MTDRRRWILAFAIAIALHEIFFGLLSSWRNEPPPPERYTQVQVIAITRRPKPSPTPRRTPRPTPTPKPRPTPRPRPTPTPKPIPHITPPPQTPAPVFKPHPPAPRHAVHHAPHEAGGGGGMAATLAAARRAGRRAEALGAGAGSGGGAGTGSSGGTGAGNGGGAGAGGAGNGTGGGGAPCGFVEFSPYAPNRYVDGHFEEPIQAFFNDREGQRLSVRFPYPWIYRSNDDDPWSAQNIAKGDYRVPLQLPPPGFDTSSLDPLLKFILGRTDANGNTRLPPCPGQSR